eukprot:g18276.t1
MNELLYARKSGSPVVFRHEEYWRALKDYDEDIADLARERHEYCSAVAAESRITAARWREARQRDQKLFELHYHFKEQAAFNSFQAKHYRTPSDSRCFCVFSMNTIWVH